MKVGGLFAIMVCAVVLSCAMNPNETHRDGVVLAWQARPLQAPPGEEASAAQVQLGRMLFYDPILSADRATACATCHSPFWGMSDGRANAIGVGGTGPVGPARTGPRSTRRNALSLWNAAYRTNLFWDGRAPSLEAQVLGPLTAADELARVPRELVADLRAIAAYEELFRAAFPEEQEPLRIENVQRSIASFVRTMVSNRAPYDAWAAGDSDALHEDELRGLQVFSAAGCARCHMPPRFESDEYHVVVDEPMDRGREEVTAQAMDRGAFRVPTLRNIGVTAPYFHDGRAANLHEVLDAKVRAGLAPSSWTAQNREDLLAFLRFGLLDRSREQHPPESVPSGLEIPFNALHTGRRP